MWWAVLDDDDDVNDDDDDDDNESWWCHMDEKKIKEDSKRLRSEKNRRKKRTWTSSSTRKELKDSRAIPMAMVAMTRMSGGAILGSRTVSALTVGSPTMRGSPSTILGSGWSNWGEGTIWAIHRWAPTRPRHPDCEPGMAAESSQLNGAAKLQNRQT